jgi:hypothetical protein
MPPGNFIKVYMRTGQNILFQAEDGGIFIWKGKAYLLGSEGETTCPKRMITAIKLALPTDRVVCLQNVESLTKRHFSGVQPFFISVPPYTTLRELLRYLLGSKS